MIWENDARSNSSWWYCRLSQHKPLSHSQNQNGWLARKFKSSDLKITQITELAVYPPSY